MPVNARSYQPGSLTTSEMIGAPCGRCHGVTPAIGNSAPAGIAPPSAKIRTPTTSATLLCLRFTGSVPRSVFSLDSARMPKRPADPRLTRQARPQDPGSSIRAMRVQSGVPPTGAGMLRTDATQGRMTAGHLLLTICQAASPPACVCIDIQPAQPGGLFPARPRFASTLMLL